MMSRRRPSYSPTAHNRSRGPSWPRHSMKGCEASRTARQQWPQTAPSSGCSSTRPHAAHGGSNRDERTVLRNVREFDAGGAAPEPIESVEIPGVLREDVDDEVEVIDEDPLGARVAFHH